MFATRRIWIPLTTAALLLPLGACGDDDDDGVTGVTTAADTGTTTGGPTTGVPTTAEPTTAGPTTGVPPTTGTTDTGEEPTADDTTGEPTEDSDVRFVHLSPDAPGVDIYLDPDADPQIEDLAFTEGTEFLGVPQGSYDVRVTATGDEPEDAVISADGFQIPAGGTFTVAAYGELDDIDLMVVEEDDSRIAEGTLRIFVGHAADGVDTVDVWAIGLEEDPVEVLSDLEYGSWEPLDIPADTAFEVGLDVDADGAPDFVFDIPELPEGITLSVFAVLDDEGPFLIAYPPEGAAVGPIRPN